MARMHCRYCEGEFNSLSAYDKHLILYKDVENEPWNGYNGRPVCKGQKQGSPFLDPWVAKERERKAQIARKHLRVRTGAENG